MRRISSSLTSWYKRFGPWLWFGSLAVATLVTTIAAIRGQLDPRLAAIAPGMALVTWFYMCTFTFTMADEVWDAGDTLVIRNKGREMSVPVCRLLSARYSCIADPPRITLKFRLSALAEGHVEFIPKIVPRMFVFRAPPIAADLASRIAKEKAKRAALELLPGKNPAGVSPLDPTIS
ncbi:MAG: hypothetical protein FGM15_09800 [Chthoniobacterales bacterium]|nr:hypothetical protein [Chthoniobacterales bacterium]